MLRRCWFWAAFCLLASAQTPGDAPPAASESPAPSPVEQPLPFSHKTHISVAKLECNICHAVAPPGAMAGIAGTATCMQCHIAIKTESPHIARLAGFDKKGEEVPWERVYGIPYFVYFSHEFHLASGKATCQTCHGQVQERDALFKEKDVTTMRGCMDCHRANDAPVDCDYCHEEL